MAIKTTPSHKNRPENPEQNPLDFLGSLMRARHAWVMRVIARARRLFPLLHPPKGGGVGTVPGGFSKLVSQHSEQMRGRPLINSGSPHSSHHN